jgi:hypothetical protein
MSTLTAASVSILAAASTALASDIAIPAVNPLVTITASGSIPIYTSSCCQAANMNDGNTAVAVGGPIVCSVRHGDNSPVFSDRDWPVLR